MIDVAGAAQLYRIFWQWSALLGLRFRRGRGRVWRGGLIGVGTANWIDHASQIGGGAGEL